MQYTLVAKGGASANTVLKDLAEAVDTKLKEGWKPQGGISIVAEQGGIAAAQALTKDV